MNRILIFSILFFINLQVSYGFSDKEINKQYGNVHVRVTTGYWYSEIDKALIAAQLAQKLSSRLHYKKPIFIDFHHYYIDNCIPDHFIAYNNGNLNDTWGVNKKKQGIISKKSIVLRQVAAEYDIEATLKLLEYAINNTSLIKREQNIFEYNKNYCQWMIESINTTLINSLLTKPTSSSVKQMMNTEIEWWGANKYGPSYYWKNNKFKLFYRDYEDKIVELIDLDDIYYIKELNTSGFTSVIFDTDSSFYFVSTFHNARISNRHVIKKFEKTYRPFQLEYLGGDKFSFYNWIEIHKRRKGRTLLYLAETDKLIQNLDTLIKSSQ